MAASDPLFIPPTLRAAARRAYERGRLGGALRLGAGAALLATPGFLICNQTPWAAVCLAGFALVVSGGRLRGEGWERGSRAGALAGILPCLFPAALRAINPDLCMLFSSKGLWICGVGGAAAGIVLGLRSRGARGLPFWGSALAAMTLAGSIGCLPVGAVGFAGLALGLVAGGAPVLVSRRALA